ncbi:hypothetical protein FRB95_008722 [Tulasnella sp. JGI-2019a]|nr:hypothetical protein FRB95_008722 [Tulasnella sp. JGI-2019a]
MSMAFGENDSTMLIVLRDGRLWCCVVGKDGELAKEFVLPVGAPLGRAEFAADGRFLAVTCLQGAIAVIDIANLGTILLPQILLVDENAQGHAFPVSLLAGFGGRYIIVTGGYGLATLHSKPFVIPGVRSRRDDVIPSGEVPGLSIQLHHKAGDWVLNTSMHSQSRLFATGTFNSNNGKENVVWVWSVKLGTSKIRPN